jgi:hypothetical protein
MATRGTPTPVKTMNRDNSLHHMSFDEYMKHKEGEMPREPPKPVVVTSGAIKTEWTAEVANNIIKKNSKWFFDNAIPGGGSKKVVSPPKEDEKEGPERIEELLWKIKNTEETGDKDEESNKGQEDQTEEVSDLDDFDFGDKWSYKPLSLPDARPESLYVGSLSLFPKQQSNAEFLDLVKRLEAMSLVRAPATTTTSTTTTTTPSPVRAASSGGITRPIFSFKTHPHLTRKQNTDAPAIVTTTTRRPNRFIKHVTTQSPSPFSVLSTTISNSAAPLAGISAATLVHAAATFLPSWMGGKKKRRRKRRSLHAFERDQRALRLAY